MTVGTVTAQVGSATDPSLVYLRVAVMDSYGRFITGLGKESFKLLEDSKLQDTVYFSNDDDSISVGILVDARPDLKDQIKAVALTAVTRYKRPLDELFFSERG